MAPPLSYTSPHPYRAQHEHKRTARMASSATSASRTSPSPIRRVCPAAPKRWKRSRRSSIIIASQKGRGFSSVSSSSSSGGLPAGFFKMINLDEIGDRKTTAVLLANDNAYVVVSSRSKFYVIDAYSTAYKYPLVDAKVDDEKCSITSPLDGTSYSLETGEVLEWCPRDNPLRFVLGALKAREAANLEAQRLRVFPVRVMDNGDIYMSETPLSF